MKRYFYIFIFLSTIHLYSQRPIKIISDTVNRTDSAAKKYGYWQIYGADKPYYIDRYDQDQVVGEGVYILDRKEGLWKEYYPNGNLKSKLVFVDGRANGEAVIYYENGLIQEKGFWRKNRFIGKHEIYFDDGNLQLEEFSDSTGKRKYSYHYNYKNGKKDTVVKYTKETGYIEKKYDDKGNFYWTKPNEYYMPQPGKYDDFKIDPKRETEPNKSPKLLQGSHTLYNKNKQITKEGTFVNNVLYDGKAYIYNEMGALIRTITFKEGKYMGDGTLAK